MIKTFLIEDEQPTVELLINMLDIYCPTVKVIGSAQSVSEAYQLILKNQPDLILLDIQLKDGNGFDLLKKFPQPNFKVIFITAFDNYAIKAFKFSAVDYILKPIDPDDLIKSINKVTIKAKYDNLPLQTLQENVKGLDKILLKTQTSYHLVKISEIIYCQSDGNYTTFFIEGNRKVLVSKPIKYYAQLLEEKLFYRTHQSYLINMVHIIRYDKMGFVYLNENIKVPLSARKSKAFLTLLNRLGDVS